MKQFINLKESQNPEELLKLHPRVLKMLSYTAEFCHKNSIKFIITDILSEASEDLALKRVSKSHSEGRAFDISTKAETGWNLELIKKFESEMNKQFIDTGAISAKDGISRAVVYHNNGNGWHLHVQCRPY